jgi:hypothetical protein
MIDIRRNLTLDERQDYIKAVKCMFNSPPKFKKYADVIHNRYEDFVVAHINTSIGGKYTISS